ncbi:MAG: HEPN domain-containing protein [Alphaproteobacteria bacterium]
MSLQRRVQADDFFKSYQVLAKYGAELANPAVVNLAFAVELYIKELHFVIKGKAPYRHNILELFRKLPEETQQEIRNYPSMQKLTVYYSMHTPLYIPQDKKKNPITDVLEQHLCKISDAFEKWRYSYEHGTLVYEESIALALIESIKSISDNLRK